MNKELKKPLVSVIMGIYNCGNTLEEAVNCIVKQTYTNWELIMCDDGSTDNTYDIACRIKDTVNNKVIVLKNEKNMGLNYTLNHCLENTSGEFIARMDGDDLCRNDRFQIEVDELISNPELAFVSTDMEFFDDGGVWGVIKHPTLPQKKDFVNENPFCHAPCMVRKEAYDAVGGYSEDQRLLRMEDYHLWMKMYLKGFVGKNIHKALYQMRDDQNAYKRRKFKHRVNAARLRLEIVNRFDLPKYMYLYAIRPIITGLMPRFIYNRLHKKRLSS